MPLAIKNGHVELHDVTVPARRMRPGECFNITVSVLNHALATTVSDDDSCANLSTVCTDYDPGSGVPGYCIYVVTGFVDGQSKIVNSCIEVAKVFVPPNQEVYSVEFVVPDLPDGVSSDTFDVFGYIGMGGTEEESDIIVRSIEVDENADLPRRNCYLSEPPVDMEVSNGDGWDVSGTTKSLAEGLFGLTGTELAATFIITVVLIVFVKDLIPE